MKIFILILLFFLNHPSIAAKIQIEEESKIANKTIPITVTVRSIKDLRVKEGQKITIGQLLALKPIEPEAPQGYISKKPSREVEKQREKLEEIKKVVKANNLPGIIIQHEEAKLKELEFEAKEFQLGAVDPKAPKETTYRSPVNGIVKRITPLQGSDGRLNVEILVEQM
ncbi:MAG: hypothetical protein SFU25_04985 [Candidatus Caenarcaniphilales bacterium]|nr:hypothetical protein [Candidatus Caenarcaniphilales bacterium]